MMTGFLNISDVSMIGMEPTNHEEESHRITIHNSLQAAMLPFVVCIVQTLGPWTGFSSKKQRVASGSCCDGGNIGAL